jgi:DNA polymerase-1
MGPNKLANQLQITIDEASDLINKYFEVFPSIKNFLDGNAKTGKEKGFIRTMDPYRRIRYFPEWRGRATEKVDMGKIDRMSRNTPIQGTAGDMTKEAMIRCRQEFLNKDDIKMVMVVHDQLDFIVKTHAIEYYSRRITHHMEAAGKSIITNGLLKADTTTAKAWEK